MRYFDTATCRRALVRACVDSTHGFNGHRRIHNSMDQNRYVAKTTLAARPYGSENRVKEWTLKVRFSWESVTSGLSKLKELQLNNYSLLQSSSKLGRWIRADNSSTIRSVCAMGNEIAGDSLKVAAACVTLKIACMNFNGLCRLMVGDKHAGR